jgi:anhydro-N-acetylmuramic acid kinase
VNRSGRAVERFIGLMSGTSLDGIDGVVCTWDASGQWQGVQAHVHWPFDAKLRASLLALQQRGDDELHRAALAANALARGEAAVVAQLRVEAGLPVDAIRAIGAHGQTVRHQPLAFDGVGYTLQLQNAALLAELTGIDIIADFRTRDLAAGGQGAPLVPTFHDAVFGRAAAARAVLNLGGIGNLTLLAPGQPPRGWDTGPGNVLMDLWIARHLGCPYDGDGAWGTTGTVDTDLLSRLLAEPYLHLTPPKSTGRDLFDAAWLDHQLAAHARPLAPVDVQATLCAYTARSVVDALQSTGIEPSDLLVCGGGALNGALMLRLAMALPGVRVSSTASAGLPPMQVEAAAFAWLAHQHVHRRPASEPAVTGARGSRVLGACYPA